MHTHLFRITKKLTALARSGQIVNARKLFDEMPERDTIAWNAMLTGYVQLGYHEEALELFGQMRNSNCKIDDFTFTSTLSACAGLGNLHSGRKLHSLIVGLGYNSFLPVNNSLIDFYGKCFSSYEAHRVFQDMGFRNEVSWCSLLFAQVNVGDFDIAHDVFYAMPKRVLIAWNTMIVGYAKSGEHELCLEFFKKMLEDSCSPDEWTLSALMNACSESCQSCYGGMIHDYIIKSGWGSAVEVNNSIISTYARFNFQSEVLKLFECRQNLNQVSWNAMIDAHLKMGNFHEALLMFQQAPEKNIVSWTSMISGYIEYGYPEQGITLFIGMMTAAMSNIKPDDFTLGAVLHACAILPTLSLGKMLHSWLIHLGFHNHVYVCNSLVNMYAKCGNIIDSYTVFNNIVERSLISWNTMIFAFGLHGLSGQALQLFEPMVSSGIKPDRVTFIGLLMTCSHSGLIETGFSVFKDMKSVHGIVPDTDHVTCMVNMMGKNGHLEEARAFSSKTSSSYEVLFGSMFCHGDLRTGREIGEQLRILEPENEMSYVVLSNMYCAMGQWKEAEMVRRRMAQEQVKKMPGLSWIEVKNEMATFSAGKHSNSSSQNEEIYRILSVLESDMRYPVYVHCWDQIT